MSGPESRNDDLANEVREASSSAKEAEAKRSTREQLNALKPKTRLQVWKEKRAERRAEKNANKNEGFNRKDRAVLEMSGIETTNRPPTPKELRQQAREERREARQERWAARGWGRGERVRDKDNRYDEDESVPQKSEEDIQADIQRYAGKTFDRMAVGDGIDMPGEGKVGDDTSTRIEDKTKDLEGRAMAGNREYNIDSALTWINEGTGEVFSAEDIAEERASAMQQAREKGQTFDEAKFRAQLTAKLSGEGYKAGARPSLERQLAKRPKKGRVGDGGDAVESSAKDKRAAAADVARREKERARISKTTAKVDRTADSPTHGLEK